MKLHLVLFAAVLPICSATLFAGGKPKYVFLFIGDGMSTPQRMVAEEFAATTGHGELAMNRLPYHATTRTRSSNDIITDSAAAGTAIACGVKTRNAMLGVTPDGSPVPSVAEVAKRAGMKVGIVTTTAITHATPAAFYAHRKNRSELYGIGLDLIASGFDYFAGGGFSCKEDDREDAMYRGNIYDLAREAGYTVATNKAQWAAIPPGGKSLCTFTQFHFGFAIDASKSRPTLAQLLEKGIESIDSPAGFFIMCEGGTIDFCSHANDAATTLHEVLALDDAVKVALAFAEKHPDETLVVVTGDHETGGLSMGFAGTGGMFHVGRLAGQKVSTERFSGRVKSMLRANINLTFEQVKPLVAKEFGLVFGGGWNPMRVTEAEEEILRAALEKDRTFIRNKLQDTTAHDAKRRYVFASTVCGVLAAHAGVGWSSGSHTALPTLTTAKGPGADILLGMMENADIGDRLKKLLSK